MARLAPDWMDNYFSYGIDNRRRRLFLWGDIDEETVATFVMGLELLKQGNTDPITVIMSSCGGDQYEMWGAYDAIRSSHRHTIRTVAVGKIMSAAPLILAAGDERYAHEHTKFMFHEESYSVEERHTNTKATVAHYEQLEKEYAKAMSERTNRSYRWWYDQANRRGKGTDTYSSAKEVLEWGLIDGILLLQGKLRKPDGKVIKQPAGLC